MLRVIGEACAGCGTRFHVARGEALRVMTGAPVPPECDCVIRQEDTDEGMEQVQMYAPVGSGKNICRAGEDVPCGACIVRKGRADHQRAHRRALEPGRDAGAGVYARGARGAALHGR